MLITEEKKNSYISETRMNDVNMIAIKVKQKKMNIITMNVKMNDCEC